MDFYSFESLLARKLYRASFCYNQKVFSYTTEGMYICSGHQLHIRVPTSGTYIASAITPRTLTWLCEPLLQTLSYGYPQQVQSTSWHAFPHSSTRPFRAAAVNVTLYCVQAPTLTILSYTILASKWEILELSGQIRPPGQSVGIGLFRKFALSSPLANSMCFKRNSLFSNNYMGKKK